MASNAQQIKELAAAVAALASGSAAVTASLQQISDNFGETIKPARALGKELDRISGSLQDTVDYNDKIEDQLKDMHRAAKELSRIKWMEGVTSEQAVKALKSQIDAMDTIRKSTEANSAANKKLTAGLAILEAQLSDVETASSGALDEGRAIKLREALEGVSDITKEFGKNLDSIDFRRPQAKLTGFGTAMSGVFGGVLGSMKIMDSYGFKNLTTALHKMKREAYDVKKSMEPGGAGAKTQEDVKRMFAKGPDGKAADPSAVQLENYKKLVSGKQAEKGAFQNLADTGLRKLMESRVKNGGGQTLTKMFAQGGGSITEGVGMSSVMGLTKFMGPIGLAITAIGGLLAAFGAVGARRKETYEALGKGGLLGTGVTPRNAYNQLQEQLSSKSINPLGKDKFETSIMGLSYEKNMATVKAMVEGGIGISALGNKNAFEELKGGRATNMMGGIMRNANYFGHNLGMNQDESVALTVKAIGEFNMSFGETEDLFININRGVTAAGVSTTKYLGIIDSISGQFSRFNKTMGDTVLVIQAMGRSGKYTADYMAEMVNAVAGGDKSNEQKAFGFSKMSQEDRKGMLKGYEDRAYKAGTELSKQLGVDVTKLSPNEINDLVNKHPGEKIGGLASQYSTSKLQADSLKLAISKGGNAGAMGMLGVSMNTGDTLQSKIATNMALLNTTIKSSGGGDMMDLLDPKKAAKLMQDPKFGFIAQAMGIKPETLATTVPNAIQQSAGTFEDNRKEKLIQEYMATKTRSGMSPEEKRKVAEEQVGKTFKPRTTAEVINDPVFKAQLRAGVFNEEIAGKIADKQRTAEEEKAQENYKVITDPLSVIKNTLKAMLDQIIKMLTVVVDWFNKWAFGSDKDKSKEAVGELAERGWTGESAKNWVATTKKDPKFAKLDKEHKRVFDENMAAADEIAKALADPEGGFTKEAGHMLERIRTDLDKGDVQHYGGLKSILTGLRERRTKLAAQAKDEKKSGDTLIAEKAAVGGTGFTGTWELDPAAWKKATSTLKPEEVAGKEKSIGADIVKFQKELADIKDQTGSDYQSEVKKINQYFVTNYGVDASTLIKGFPSPKEAPKETAK